MTKARTLADNYAADINQITASAPLTGGGTSGTVTVGIQAGTTAQSGAVQLTDSTASTSTTTAATPNSVKSAYDLANGAIAKSTIDAKGDLLVGSANDTVSRLAVASTAGYLLTVDSGETTGLKWAAPASGDLVKLASGTISGTAISFNNVFSSTYTNYWFWWTCTDSDGDTKMRYRVSNADDSTSQYRYVNMSLAFGGTPAWGVLSNGTSQDHLLNLPYASNRPYKFGIGFTGTVDGSLLELINYEGFFNGADAHSGVCFGRRSDGTAYDGFSVFTNGSTMSGTYALYAYKR